MSEIDILPGPVERSYGFIETGEIIRLIEEKPKPLLTILTGRGAPEELIDTVLEIKEIKHAYSKGIKARKGIEC